VAIDGVQTLSLNTRSLDSSVYDELAQDDMSSSGGYPLRLPHIGTGTGFSGGGTGAGFSGFAFKSRALRTNSQNPPR